MPIITLTTDFGLSDGVAKGMLSRMSLEYESDALFIDNKQVSTGPPPSYKKIERLIAKRVRKL